MPNFFELLELDPDMPWEPQGREQYERQLQKMRAKWASQRNAPGKIGVDATLHFNMVRDGVIQATMEDAAKRQIQAQEERRRRADKRTRLREALAQWRKESPFVTQEQIGRWRHEYEVDASTMEELLRESGLSVASGDEAAARINPITLKSVRETLDALRKLDPENVHLYRTLYTFLERDPKDSSDLSKVAEDIYEQHTHNMNKTVALTKKIELAGSAKTIFASAASRKQYDEALRLEPLEQLLVEMVNATGGAAPRAGHIDAYLLAAEKAGFTEDDIRRELEYRAQQQKWGVIEIPRRRGQQICPFCSSRVEPDANSCQTCGSLLKLDCPDCHEPGIAADRAACPKCGFLTGQRGWVIGLVDDGREAIGRYEFEAARPLIKEAQSLWSPATPDPIAMSIAELQRQIRQYDQRQVAVQLHQKLDEADRAIDVEQYSKARDLRNWVQTRLTPENPERDAIQARIRELGEKLAPHEAQMEQERIEAEKHKADLLAELTKSIDQIRQYKDQRNLMAARNLLERLSSADRQQPEVVSLAHTIEQELGKANSLLQRAKGAASIEARIELCHEALDICADHREAQDMLRGSRPPAPNWVRISLETSGNQQSVRVTWEPVSEKRVTYSVVRKAHSAPVSELDGDFVRRDTTDLNCEDNPRAKGVELYYAVFTKRDQVDIASAPAPAPYPVVLTEDVKDARVDEGDAVVKLTWTAPAGAEVLVVRKEGAAPIAHDDKDGKSVRVVNSHEAVDSGLTNGKTYYYGIYCRFARGTISHGITVKATPHVRPGAPSPLIINERLNGVGWYDIDLQWGDDSRRANRDAGRKVVYRIDPTPLFTSGAELSADKVGAYIWRTIEIRNGRGEDQIPQPGVVTYVPAVIVEGTIYSGAPQRKRLIPPLEQVEAYSVVGAIRVTWKWPPRIERVVIAPGAQLAEEYSSEEALKRAGAIFATKSASDDVRGQHDFPAQARRRTQLVIAPVVTSTDGVVLVGAATPLQGEAAEMGDISYEFGKPGFGRGNNHTLLIRVRSRGPLSTLPPLVVRIKEGQEPGDRNDGQEWWRYAEQPLPASEIRLNLPGLPERGKRKGPALHGAVFFADDTYTKLVRLVSAGAERTRLT